MQLNWMKSASSSALHTAYACHCFRSRVIDPKVQPAMGPFAKRLGDWIDGRQPAVRANAWGNLIGSGAEIESNGLLAAEILRGEMGTGRDASLQHQLTGLITDVEAAFQLLFPKYMEQCELRMRPLQDQWLGFGNGLMAHLGRMTEKHIATGSYRVVALQPVVGGGGQAHPRQGIVSIEAVLTNPLAELPEVVRLAWLLSQLKLNDPVYTDALGVGMAQKLAPLAMLPPALAAAEVLEISKCNEVTAELAIENWDIAVPSSMDVTKQLIPALMDWWETYLQTRPTWALALKALCKRLAIMD
ncbi:MAG: hypothetical protein WCI02_05650 [Planctomycetota bacterium]